MSILPKTQALIDRFTADVVAQHGRCADCGDAPVNDEGGLVWRYAVPLRFDPSKDHPAKFSTAPNHEPWRCGPCTVAAYQEYKQQTGRAA